MVILPVIPCYVSVRKFLLR